MQGKVMNNANGQKGAPAKPRAMKRVTQATPTDALYMFNIEDNGGFVIVSGDERTEAILGYSTEGNIDPQIMPENMKALLKSYEEQIKSVSADAKPVPAEMVTHPAIAPMLESFWGQGAPYNNLCPEMDGQRSITGCVATALAQIMYYHKWPESFTTDIPAYDYTLQSWNNESQSWDNLTAEALPATQFDWDNMTTDYFENSSEESKEAVAKLMRYCGQAFWMGYGINESGTNLSFYQTLQHYFGYSDKVRLVSFSNYNPTEWDQLIYNELQHQRPVLYSSSSIFGNHAFVCDGYDGEGYYHMNIGYEGYYNGWYLLRILNGSHNLDIVGFGTVWSPESDFQPEAIVGIQRPGNEATLPLTLAVTASLKYDGSEEAFKLDCYNLSDTDRQLECGLRCYNTTNDNIEFNYFGGMQLLAGQIATGAIPVSVGNFSEGIRYRLCPIWRETGEESWHVLNAQSIEIIMMNGRITELARDGVGASIDVIGQLVENSTNFIVVSINNGKFDLKDNIYIDIIDKSTGNIIQRPYDNQHYVCLSPSEQCMLKDYFDNYLEGNYQIVVKMKDSQIASLDFHISKKMDVAFSEDAVPQFDWKSKSFKVLVVNNDRERVYDKAVWAYVAPRTIFFEQPISASSPYFKDCQILKSENLHIEPGASAWVTVPCGDAQIDMLSCAQFVVCQNVDEDRYESSCNDNGENKVWRCELIDGENWIRMYDGFAIDNSAYQIEYWVIDDEAKVCLVNAVHCKGEYVKSVFIPGKFRHPDNGEWYSVIGVDNHWDIYNTNNVVIGEGITCLKGMDYYYYTSEMESFTLPASLNHLTNTTLSLAATPNLKSIYCKASVPPTIEGFSVGNNIPNGILYEGKAQVFNHPSGEIWIPSKADYNNITLYVPIGCRDAYAKAWSSFVHIVEMNVADMPSTTSDDQVSDLTALVGVTAEDWHAGGMVGWASPEVTTRDGRTTALAERYEETTETTGTVMEQTVTGLENGLYRVTLYANACYTPGRGFDSDITDGQMDVVYLFANDAKRYIPARIKETLAEHGEYTLTATVTDGTLHLGMVAEKPGTNWHSMQIKSLDRIDVIGDVNGDGAVDVSDYIGIANYILGQTQEGFNEKAADVNGDGKVDVSDYIGVANIILTSSVYGSGN